MKALALVVLVLAGAVVVYTLAQRRPEASTWCLSKPAEVCASVHPPTTLRRSHP